MNGQSLDLEPGAHVTLDGAQAVYAIVARRLDGSSPSGVAFRLLPDAGNWIDASRVAYAAGYTERGEPDDEDDGQDSDPFFWVQP